MGITGKHVAGDNLFLAKLSLPVHGAMLHGAVACTRQVAELLSFDEGERAGLELAVEEAFVNAVEHFSGVPGPEERIHLEFLVEEGTLVISIRERGIPFKCTKTTPYAPESSDSMDCPGLGMLFMQHGVDSVEQFVHGRDGKETRLKKAMRYGALPQVLVDLKGRRRGAKRILAKEYVIRQPRPEEIGEISRLAWRCYGYTQEAFLYDREALSTKVASGEFVSLVAFSEEGGTMIGHMGLKYHDPESRVPELSLTFVDPAYRAPGMPLAMGKKVLALAESRGADGMFDCSVTTHTFSQRGLQEGLGSRPCSLFLGIAAEGMRIRELATSRQEKGSVINHYYPFNRSERTLYVPARHQAMIEDIYGWMDLPRRFAIPATSQPEGGSSVSVFPLPDELNVTFIIVHAIGRDTEVEVQDALRQCRRERRDVVYAMLPLGHRHTPVLSEACERMGFSFSGIMPHIHDGDDRLLLQFVDIELDFDAIRVYGDMSRRLKQYVEDDLRRVQEGP